MISIFSSTESRLNNKVDLHVVGGYSVAGSTATGMEGGERVTGEYEYDMHPRTRAHTHTYVQSHDEVHYFISSIKVKVLTTSMSSLKQ